MKLKLTFLSIVAATALLVGCAGNRQKSQVVTTPLVDATTQAQVDAIYDKMTPEERIAQLQGIRVDSLLVDGKISIERCRKFIPNGIGHFSQFACMIPQTPNELRDIVRDLQNYLINETPSGIPAIFHEEAITGFAGRGATTYPQQLGMSCTWNTDLMAKKTEFTAKSMREVGSVMALSPNLDVIRTAVFNRGEEALGEDSYLTSRLGVAFVEGLQCGDLSEGVAACAKHYLGYGGGSNNNRKVLFEEILMPYDAVINVAGCKNVMTAYHEFEDTYCVFNKYIITDILRGYLNFDGVLVSDYGAIAQKAKEPGQTDEQRIVRATNAIKAGCDIEFSDGVCFPLIPQAIAQGKLTEKDVETAVKRHLAIKIRLGLFDKDKPLYSEGDIDMDKPEYRALAYESAVQSVVLLKNNGILPLSANSGAIGLTGPNANSCWAMLGDYTYQSMHYFHRGGNVSFEDPKVYTLRESMENKLKGAKMDYQRGCDWSMDSESYLNLKAGEDSRFSANKVNRLKLNLFESVKEETSWSKAIAMAKNSDVVIAAMGENLALCGEGRGRAGIGLPGEQQKLVEEIIDLGKPVVLVVFGGRAQVLSQKVLDGAAAIVQAWYPGEEGGNAVADILFGNVNPSGKLSTTYSNAHKVVDVCYNRADEGVEAAIFPFGYGLSYTTYEYSNISMVESAEVCDEVELSFEVANTGKMAGEEIVQLYVSPLDANLPLKPIQLKGFDRVSLKPGESRKVTFSIPTGVLAHYVGEDLESCYWAVTPGAYRFKVGASSQDIRLSADLELTGDEYHSRNREVFFTNSVIK